MNVAATAKKKTAGQSAHAITADQHQADYFLRMRMRIANRRLSDLRIDKWRRQIASAEVAGDLARARRYRREMRAGEDEHRAVTRCIDNLRRRFSDSTADQVFRIPRRARLVVR